MREDYAKWMSILLAYQCIIILANKPVGNHVMPAIVDMKMENFGCKTYGGDISFCTMRTYMNKSRKEDETFYELKSFCISNFFQTGFLSA
jgi:hypothetical protein